MIENIDPDNNFFNEIHSSISQLQQSQYFTIEQYNTHFQNSQLFILSLNIRSFNANIESFYAVLQSLNKTPDIIILTETWINDDNIERSEIEGYHSFHTLRQGGGRGGGVSIFCRYYINVEHIHQCSVATNTIESCVVRIESAQYKLLILGIYRPHSDSVHNFTEQLERMLLENTDPSEKSVLLGDFNINLLEENNAAIEDFQTMLQALHFLPTITKPTRMPSPTLQGNPSLLDHIWVNQLQYNNSGILLSDLTDHCPIFIHLPYISSNNNSIKITFRVHEQENIDKFLQKLSSINWNFEEEVQCVDRLTTNFISKLNETYQKCFPLKTKQIGAKRLQKPWLTSGILKSIKTKSNYYKLFKLGLISKQVNNQYRNKLTTIIRRSKELYYRNAFQNCRYSIKETWRLIKNITSQTNNHKTIDKIMVNDAEITSDNEIAEIFNDYFSNIALNLDSRIPHYPTSPMGYLRNSVPHSIFLRPITSNECANIIDSLKNTSYNKDTLPVKIFKLAKHILIEPIRYLINMSIENGVFPDVLKCANVTPIFKNGDRCCVANYRPVSVLPYLSKIFEKCIANRVLGFIDSNKIITPNQFGFQKGKSTEQAILKLIEGIHNALNSKKHHLSIFVDLSKAFDTVNHAILLQKLYHYGIRGPAYSWFESYLSDRQQRVKIGSCFSSSAVLNIGVPQGSILGPILFILYINDLPKALDLMSAILFADDTTLSIQDANYYNLIQEANVELENIMVWAAVNRLSINTNKTFAMLFTNRQHDIQRLNILLNEEAIDLKETGKFLGVTLDDSLKYNEHISNICKKVSKTIGLFYRLRCYVNTQTMIILYYSLIYPYIIYCNTVWGGTYASHLTPLAVLQKKIIRIITGADYLAHTDPLFFQTKILKVSDIHKFQLGIYMFKKKLRNNLPSIQHNYNTRGSNSVPPRFQRLTVTQHSVEYSAPHFWNSLPGDVKNASSLSTFKTALKTHLLSTYI